jgi:hypothetical protein
MPLTPRTYRFYILVLLIAGCRHVGGQSRVLNGLIRDRITGMGVANALVLNYSTRVNVYSDSNGIFKLQVSFGDTIVLSAVGYYYNRIVVKDSLLEASAPAKFTFTPRAYEISEARIIGLGSYNDFRNSFVEMKRPKTKIEILTENLATISKVEGKVAYDMALANGRLEHPLPGIPILSPEEKERIALKKIMEKELIREQVYQKFNPELIKKLTGLTDDRNIVDFMTFCDFSDDYVISTNEYDLDAQIALKFEAYKSKRVNIF